LAPEGMNAIVFGREKGRGQKALATRCASCTAIACSIILSSVKLEKSQEFLLLVEVLL